MRLELPGPGKLTGMDLFEVLIRLLLFAGVVTDKFPDSWYLFAEVHRVIQNRQCGLLP
ncbi:hypothetical protein D3C72_2251890 [compost metagenome]